MVFIADLRDGRKGASRSRPLAAAIARFCSSLVWGILVRAIGRVPENTMKFVVGMMFTTGFGIFWATEGAGVDWPGSAGQGPAGPHPSGDCHVSLLYVELLTPPAARAEVYRSGGRVHEQDRKALPACSGGTSSSATTGSPPPAWPSRWERWPSSPARSIPAWRVLLSQSCSCSTLAAPRCARRVWRKSVACPGRDVAVARVHEAVDRVTDQPRRGSTPRRSGP